MAEDRFAAVRERLRALRQAEAAYEQASLRIDEPDSAREIIDAWVTMNRAYTDCRVLPEEARSLLTALDAAHELLAEILAEFVLLDEERGRWHAPGLVDRETWERWQREAGCE